MLLFITLLDFKSGVGPNKYVYEKKQFYKIADFMVWKIKTERIADGQRNLPHQINESQKNHKKPEIIKPSHISLKNYGK